MMTSLMLYGGLAFSAVMLVWGFINWYGAGLEDRRPRPGPVMPPRKPRNGKRIKTP